MGENLCELFTYLLKQRVHLKQLVSAIADKFNNCRNYDYHVLSMFLFRSFCYEKVLHIKLYNGERITKMNFA